VRREVGLVRGGRSAIPVTWGVLRPTILLPADAERWSEPLRRSVLLHELAHVRRRDALTAMLAQVARAALWFHPAAWVMAHRVRAECELACDEGAVASGAEPDEYAQSLLDLALSRRGVPPLSPAVLGAAAVTLERRIARLAAPSAPTRGAGGATVRLAPLAPAALALLAALSMARAGAVDHAGAAMRPVAPLAAVGDDEAGREPTPGAGPGSFRTDGAPRLRRFLGRLAR
jgi:beta-lactamase regulating signal transducer with metallopeptidase domain